MGVKRAGGRRVGGRGVGVGWGVILPEGGIVCVCVWRAACCMGGWVMGVGWTGKGLFV